MSRFGRIFDVKVNCIVNINFNDFKSFLTFSKNSVHVHVYVNFDDHINRKLYNQNLESELESNCNNFKLDILFSVSNTVKNIVISPNFLMWKFCEKKQFPHSFGRFARNSAETVPFLKISTPGN